MDFPKEVPLWLLEFFGWFLENWVEIVGYVANALYLSAFWLASSGRVPGDGKIYNYLNLFGALALIAHAHFKGSIPIVLLEIAWIILALVALRKAYRVK